MKPAQFIVLGFSAVAGVGAFYLVGRDPAPVAPEPVAVAPPPLETVEILVANKDINVGQAIQAGDMMWQSWPRASGNAAFLHRNERPDAAEQLAGAIARSPIGSGEPVREAKLIKAKGSGYLAAILPSGMRAVSTEISPETGAGGFILPNDRVDVILSRRDKEAERLTGVETMVAETLLSDVQILAVDQTVEEKNGQRVVVGKTATLELTPRQTEIIAVGRLQGTLSLALRSLVDSDPSRRPQTVQTGDLSSNNRINMVRFGVTTTMVPK